jgi:hypothetical protein
MPFAATTREGVHVREEIAPFGLRAGSLAHAAHTLSPVETVLLMGLARSRCGHPLIRDDSRVQTPFEDSLEPPRLGLTTQARQ